jgi:hypothetical protein
MKNREGSRFVIHWYGSGIWIRIQKRHRPGKLLVYFVVAVVGIRSRIRGISIVLGLRIRIH